MDSILAIDQDLVTDAVRQFALTTIEAYKNRAEIKWNDAELGIYLVYMFGEINKTGGKGRAAFRLAPAIPKDVPKDARKSIDYGDYPPISSHHPWGVIVCTSGFRHVSVSTSNRRLAIFRDSLALQ
ncbi:hypothetical protein F5879DRAFT_994339 [Lentinula edodes]|nr:hypothetical protein F5879DRAFT_994339 [Lentinula edodes]KAJ3911851.1 hypothetical protein F5877DRAFT_85477 [Lentinula edodes]